MACSAKPVTVLVQHYKDMKVMKDKDLAVKNGLVMHEKLESFCIGCHNVESPTYVDMDIRRSLAKD